MFVHPATPFPDRPLYRPYLGGPPRFTPSLSPIPRDHWLHPDPEHEANLANRTRILAAHPESARWNAESLPAQSEALNLICAALREHAPEILPRLRGRGVRRDPAQRDEAHGVSTVERLRGFREGRERRVVERASPAPILQAGALLADDLVIMEKRQEESRQGPWRATALLLTAPTFFSASEAFGRDLSALHAPVPGNAPSETSIGLAGRIAALFDRLPADTVMQRFNWTLQCGPDRYAPDGAALRARAERLGPPRAAESLHLRVERQTIRRLPRTGAILFTIRVALDPLAALDGENLAAITTAWRAADAQARTYKGWAALDGAARIAFNRDAGPAS